MNNETNYCGERKSCQKGDCKGCLLRGIEEPKLGEECGVFGMYDLDGNDVASSIYYGLFALQHRGQESCGIAVSRTDGPPRNSNVCKGMGLVNEVFNAENLEKMAGDMSGWLYLVDGVTPNVGSSACKLKGGEHIEWTYTCSGRAGS